MKLSAPVHRLKRNARMLSRKAAIPLHAALDRIAHQEGYRDWNLLAAKLAAQAPAEKLFAQLVPGDLLLVGARPGQGKTLLCLQLAVEAIKSGNHGVVFTLEYAEQDVLQGLRRIGVDPARLEGRFELNSSDAISAEHMMAVLASAPHGTLAVMDYLQLLDQRRENPALMAQVQALKAFARERGLILVFSSQIDRTYDPQQKPWPDANDVRLPNPLDLTLFDKACFLNNGAMRFGAMHA